MFIPLLLDAAVAAETKEAAEAFAEQTTGTIAEKTDALGDFFTSLGLGGLSSLLSAVVVFVICLVAIKIITHLLDRLFKRDKHMDETVKRFLHNGINIALWVVAIVIVAGTLGIPTASLVAVISVAGVALSLSLQGTLTNIFSGVTLLLTRPFSVGDYIKVGENEGYVRAIRLFYTTIYTGDKRLITIPNGTVASAAVVNCTREPLRRLDFLYTADYNDATENVKAALLDAAAGNPLALADPAPIAFISAFQDSAIEYTLRVWCKAEDYFALQISINEPVRDQFDKHGVHMTFNHINVHMMKE